MHNIIKEEKIKPNSIMMAKLALLIALCTFGRSVSFRVLNRVSRSRVPVGFSDGQDVDSVEVSEVAVLETGGEVGPGVGTAAAAIETLAAPVPRELTPISALQVLKASDAPVLQKDGTGYIMCSSCKSAFAISETELGRRGCRVRCGVCDKEWYQSGERLLTTDATNVLAAMSEDKVTEIRKSIAERNWPKYPKVDKIGIFVGNLPYDFTEKEMADIFSEYGVTGISLVRDPTGVSKGFGFVELTNQKDVDLMVKEMHLFRVDSQRALTVRAASNDPNRGGGARGGSGPPGGRDVRGGGGGGGGGGAAGAGRAGGGGGGKAWTPGGKSWTPK